MRGAQREIEYRREVESQMGEVQRDTFVRLMVYWLRPLLRRFNSALAEI